DIAAPMIEIFDAPELHLDRFVEELVAHHVRAQTNIGALPLLRVDALRRLPKLGLQMFASFTERPERHLHLPLAGHTRSDTPGDVLRGRVSISSASTSGCARWRPCGHASPGRISECYEGISVQDIEPSI